MSAAKTKGFRCPLCGCTEWGSAYNFDGPGDVPAGPHKSGLDSGARSVDFRGTFTRMCHGYVLATDGRGGYQGCSYRWNSRDDAAHDIEPPSPTPAVGWAAPR
jgi:hypothetical protein